MSRHRQLEAQKSRRRIFTRLHGGDAAAAARRFELSRAILSNHHRRKCEVCPGRHFFFGHADLAAGWFVRLGEIESVAAIEATLPDPRRGR
jgi:hypothetical protein